MNPNIIWMSLLLFIILFASLCAVMAYCRRLGEQYLKLEEWAEDWMKRLEQKHEANENHVAKCAAKIAELEQKLSDVDTEATDNQDFLRDAWNAIGELQKLLPKDGNGEVIRNQILLQQMNDEMERGLRMEKEWNDGLSSILNYGKPITNEVKTNE